MKNKMQNVNCEFRIAVAKPAPPEAPIRPFDYSGI
jgi:hypothetical protein